jgi:CheY-like chemotaxis protein
VDVMDIENKPRILITEDDAENQRFLRMFLQRNFITDICDSDVTFYENLRKNKYDVILMDISLKGNKNGLELTRELKANPEYRNIPIVCLTAHAFKKDVENALDAGVDVFLTKPVDNHVLMRTLLNAANKKIQGENETQS